MQVLSLNSPGIQAEIDSQVAIRKRFAGWAALPLQDPSAAANELERTVRDDGFCGAHINGHCLGKDLDHPDFDVVWERAAARDGKTVAVAKDTASLHRHAMLHPEIHLLTTAKESDGDHLALAGKVNGVGSDNLAIEGLLATLSKSDDAQLRTMDVPSPKLFRASRPF